MKPSEMLRTRTARNNGDWKKIHCVKGSNTSMGVKVRQNITENKLDIK